MHDGYQLRVNGSNNMALGLWMTLYMYVYVVFAALRGAWALSELNASSVKVGYLFEKPRLEDNHASEAVITKSQLGSVLRLLCFIDPPLPDGDEYLDNRNNIVQWRKVAPIPGNVDSVRYWADDRAKTAVSFSKISVDILGTYSCSYGGLSQTIDVLAADIKVGEDLQRPSNFQDMSTLMMFTKDKSGLDHWTEKSKLLQPVGTLESCPGKVETQEKPRSVHSLQPSDIATVAAIGDGFTTGFGARATVLNGLFTEYKEVSWSIGGDGNLTSTLTLPNILKEFNPNLKGFSQRSSDESEAGQQNEINLNVAFSGATTRNIEDQAQDLVMRMKQSKEIDLKNDWKLLTIWIGTNDLCNACKEKGRLSPADFIKSIMHTLNYLHKEVPRLFVNLVPPLDVSLLDDLYKEHESCKISGVYACDCVATGDNEAKKAVANTAKEYVHLLNELVYSGVYDRDDQFTVVIQPALQKPPLAQSGGHKKDMFAPDCHHFSTVGHAAAAAALWNNMMEPVFAKGNNWGDAEQLDCPSEGQPYLSTKLNSNTVASILSDDDSESGFPSSAAIALSVCLTCVVILAVTVVCRSRRSRPRLEARKLLYAPYRPNI